MVVAGFLTFKNTFHIGKKQRSFPPSSCNNSLVFYMKRLCLPSSQVRASI